jgi:PKD repeat protein
VSVTPDSGQVAVSDSVTLNVTISTVGLANGTYNGTIGIETNDPNQPIVDLPLHLVVNGAEQIALVDTACLSFPSIQQGASAMDTVQIANIGCDTLSITAASSGTGYFSIANLPLDVAPGDTIDLEVLFAPITVGTFNDSISLTNSDTAVTICVSGSSVGAPLPQIAGDSIVVELNKCKVITNESFKIRNLGQGALNFDLSIGRFSTPSSNIPYNTNGAQTTHNFNGLPTSADSIIVEVILNGDYEWWNEDTDVYLDNFYIGEAGNGGSFYSPDTFYFYITGATANARLSDGSLSVRLNNTFSVDGGTGSFHEVKVTIVQSINWVSILGANNGTVAANDSVNRNLLFNAALLPLGRHVTYLSLASNAPTNNPLIHPIILNVVSEPDLVLSDTCAFFPLTRLNDTSIASLTVYNDGCQPLNVSSIVSTSPQFKVSPNNGNIPVGDSLVLQISFIPTQISNFSASLLLNSNDTNRIICLSGTSGADPIADFNFNNENVCLGEIAFTNQSQYFTNLIWDFGDGNTSNLANPVHAYARAGTYKVTLRASNNLGFDTISKFVSPNPQYVQFGISADTIQLQDTAYFSDSSSQALSWFWDFGDGTTSNQQNPSHQYSAQGRFTVRLTVNDVRGCSNSTSRPIWVENQIGLSEWAQNGDILVYPNPSEGIFTLRRLGEANRVDQVLNLSDAAGRKILRIELKQSEDQYQLDLSDYPVGLYHLQLTEQGKTIWQEKLIRR